MRLFVIHLAGLSLRDMDIGHSRSSEQNSYFSPKNERNWLRGFGHLTKMGVSWVIGPDLGHAQMSWLSRDKLEEVDEQRKVWLLCLEKGSITLIDRPTPNTRTSITKAFVSQFRQHCMHLKSELLTCIVSLFVWTGVVELVTEPVKQSKIRNRDKRKHFI